MRAAHLAELPEDVPAGEAVGTGRRGRKEPPTPLATSRSTGGGGCGLWDAHTRPESDSENSKEGMTAVAGVCCVEV